MCGYFTFPEEKTVGKTSHFIEGGSLDFSSFESPPCRVTQDVFIEDGTSHILETLF